MVQKELSTLVRVDCVHSSLFEIEIFNGIKVQEARRTIYDSVQFNGTNCLQITTYINYNDLRVCCFSRKIRFLSIDTQNCPSIYVVEVLHFLEVGHHVVL